MIKDQTYVDGKKFNLYLIVKPLVYPSNISQTYPPTYHHHQFLG